MARRREEAGAWIVVTGLVLLAAFRLWQGRTTRAIPWDDPPPAHSIEINRATEDELMLLPGIGPARARSIVVHRRLFGPFRDARDLERVDGLGRRAVERIGPLVIVE